MPYSQAWEQGRKNEKEKSGARRAEPQVEIWGKEEGWLPEREPCPQSTFKSLEENP